MCKKYKCSKFEKVKDSSEFYKANNSRMSLYYCKDCHKEYNRVYCKQYYFKRNELTPYHKEKARQYQKEYRERRKKENLEEWRDYQNQKQNEFKERIIEFQENKIQCSKCKEVKPKSEFYKNKLKNNGLSSICKKCQAEATKNSRIKNPEKYKEHKKNWYIRKKQREFDIILNESL